MFFERERRIFRASLKNNTAIYGLGFCFLFVRLSLKETEKETTKLLSPAVLLAKTPVLSAVSEGKKRTKFFLLGSS